MPAKIIAVSQQKGGAGKTTLAAHLAVAFCQNGKRVALIDIDPQGSLTKWHQLRAEKFGEDYTGIIFSNISGWRLSNEIESIKRKADIIIIDSPPHTQTETKTAIRVADLVLIPAQPSPTDLWATSETIELVDKERIPHRILLNRVVHNSKLVKNIEGKFSSLMKSKLGNRIMFASAMMDGRAVTETSPSSAAAGEVKSVVLEVTELLFPVTEKTSKRRKKVS